jgi:hypothetical protein
LWIDPIDYLDELETAVLTLATFGMRFRADTAGANSSAAPQGQSNLKLSLKDGEHDHTQRCLEYIVQQYWKPPPLGSGLCGTCNSMSGTRGRTATPREHEK